MESNLWYQKVNIIVRCDGQNSHTQRFFLVLNLHQTCEKPLIPLHRLKKTGSLCQLKNRLSNLFANIWFKYNFSYLNAYSKSGIVTIPVCKKKTDADLTFFRECSITS